MTETTSENVSTNEPAELTAPFEFVVDEAEMNFEGIKNSIYRQMKLVVGSGASVSKLRLAADIYEILNKRLVFKTAAHKEAPNLITPFGNLHVLLTGEAPKSGSFIIE